jgi:hypothetical protein
VATCKRVQNKNDGNWSSRLSKGLGNEFPELPQASVNNGEHSISEDLRRDSST